MKAGAPFIRAPAQELQKKYYFVAFAFVLPERVYLFFSSINSRLNFFVCDIYCLCDRHLQLIPYRMSLLSVIH